MEDAPTLAPPDESPPDLPDDIESIIEHRNEEWQSHIVGEADVPPGSLVANQRNWRSHPEDQREAMRAIFEKVGWLQRIVVNKRSGQIVDGHMRVELAVEQGLDTVPVQYVDLNEEAELVALATIDTVSQLVEPLPDKLAELFDLSTFHEEGRLAPFAEEMRDRLAMTQPDFTGETPAAYAPITDPAKGQNRDGTEQTFAFQFYLRESRHKEFVAMLAQLREKWGEDADGATVYRAVKEALDREHAMETALKRERDNLDEDEGEGEGDDILFNDEGEE